MRMTGDFGHRRGRGLVNAKMLKTVLKTAVTPAKQRLFDDHRQRIAQHGVARMVGTGMAGVAQRTAQLTPPPQHQHAHQGAAGNQQ
ncbi:hypothetical protein D3C73_1050330 [compost metagenome]